MEIQSRKFILICLYMVIVVTKKYLNIDLVSEKYHNITVWSIF